MKGNRLDLPSEARSMEQFRFESLLSKKPRVLSFDRVAKISQRRDEAEIHKKTETWPLEEIDVLQEVIEKPAKNTKRVTIITPTTEKMMNHKDIQTMSRNPQWDHLMNRLDSTLDDILPTAEDSEDDDSEDHLMRDPLEEIRKDIPSRVHLIRAVKALTDAKTLQFIRSVQSESDTLSSMKLLLIGRDIEAVSLDHQMDAYRKILAWRRLRFHAFMSRIRNNTIDRGVPKYEGKRQTKGLELNVSEFHRSCFFLLWRRRLHHRLMFQEFGEFIGRWRMRKALSAWTAYTRRSRVKYKALDMSEAHSNETLLRKVTPPMWRGVYSRKRCDFLCKREIFLKWKMIVRERHMLTHQRGLDREDVRAILMKWRGDFMKRTSVVFKHESDWLMQIVSNHRNSTEGENSALSRWTDKKMMTRFITKWNQQLSLRLGHRISIELYKIRIQKRMLKRWNVAVHNLKNLRRAEEHHRFQLLRHTFTSWCTYKRKLSSDRREMERERQRRKYHELEKRCNIFRSKLECKTIVRHWEHWKERCQGKQHASTRVNNFS
ncbi:hypothetical protein PROFUN_06776 [Planoprotostelium fungivorum]|uniref:Sfi1 spindle body domain-containing protein n=1 Tax=Planoprotostelium fungivorum TaxID=1890364 RepID=A0A2P6NNK8_9EUKA|nr:hypothetical protein PROFUN_06776 [Planoprotostelium fungivorum]